MKKLYLLLLSVVSNNNERIKTLGISFLVFILSSITLPAFSQVIVTPANNTSICAQTAVNGFAPACTTLGVIGINETVTTDFVMGPDQITLVPPAGWNFCTGSTPVAAKTGGDIISINVTTFSASSLTVTFTVGAQISLDQITITGLMVQPATTSAPPGSITASSVTGITGVTAGTTDFGDLAVIPGPITGIVMITTLCAGETIALTDLTPGGLWTSSKPAVGTVDGAGNYTAIAPGSGDTVFYTLGGCKAIFGPVTVLKSPRPIVGLRDTCAWFPRYYIHDVDSPGVWSTGGGFGAGPTVTTVGAGGGTGYLVINGPGVDTIKFTLLSTGCTVYDTFTVWPLPTPILGDDTVCQGSTTLLSDAFGGGVWSSSNTNASVSGGLVTGMSPGTATIFYTLPTGCHMDTTVFVNPIPKPIMGSPNACLFQTTALSDSTGGGTWTSSNTLIAIVDPVTGLVTGELPGGVATISYTLSTGCYVTLDVTVNPLPVAITATSTEECQGDSSIVLNDASGGGNWSSVNPAIGTVDNFTGSVYGVGGGVDTVLYSFPTGCNASITVTIDPLPLPITGADSLCVGQVITLTDLTPGGSWKSSNTSIATVDPAGFVFGVVPSPGGIVTITYTSPKGCFVTYTLTVNPLPAPISGINALCVGATTTLSDATPGGYWLSSTTTVATIDSNSGFLDGVTIGSSTITYILYTGGCKAPLFPVTVTPTPTVITGPTSVCAGQTITITDSVGGGTWSSLNIPVATVTPFTFNSAKVLGVSAGTATIVYTIGAGCTATTTVTVLDLGPITGSATVCVGDSVQLSDSSPFGTWSSSNTLLATADSTTGFITGVAPGVDTIYYSLPSGCVGQYTMTVNPLAPITVVMSDTICQGQYTILSDAVPGGTWSSNNTATLAITSPTVGPLGDTITSIGGSGNVIISYILPTGCFAIIAVQINPNPPSLGVIPPICEGSSATITDPFTSGTFTHTNPLLDTIVPTGGGGYSATIFGRAGGLDTITFTYATGCKTTDTVRIDPIDPISGDFEICVGTTTTLTDTTAGGAWTSSNTTVATIGTAGLLSGLVAGTSVITYTMPTGCTVIQVVTVDPLPAPITGPGQVCEKATITLSDATSAGFWTSSSTANATIDIILGVVKGVKAGTTTITYTITRTGCTVTTVVTVNPIPAPILPDPADVCLHFTITLTDASPLGVWSSSNTGISVIDPLSGLDSGVAPGVDTIRYTFPITGCFVWDTLTVHAPPVVTAIQSPAGTICIGGSVLLTASGATADGILGTYVWTPSYALSSTTIFDPVASPTVTTTYTVVGTTHWGCSDTTTITVLVDTFLIHLKITGRDSICAGDTAKLTATGNPNALFSWLPIAGLSCTICDTTIARPTVTTIYEATAIDALGCKDSAAFKLTVLPLPQLSVIGEPNSFPVILCRGTPLQLIARGAWSYVWTPNLFLSCDSCANPVATDTFNFQYELTGYSEFGCVDSMPVKVSVLDTNYNIVSGDTAICIGTLAHLSAFSHSVNGNLDRPTYLWSPPDGLSDPNSPDPFASPGVTTTYTLVITENACFSDTVHVKVSVEPYPAINLTPRSETVYAGTPIQAIAEVLNTPVKSYTWTPNTGVSCDTCFNPIITPTNQQQQYTITVTSIYGCTSVDTVTFLLSCNNGQVFIPNTFTPNGDGVNDRFFVSAIGLKTIVYMRVYNRWGQLIFEADNINPNDAAAGWDGTFKGQVLAPDVFIYEVSAICELGAPFTYKGDVSIVR